MGDFLNLNGLNVDDSGRVSFSGLKSGINFIKAIDAIIAARRIPVDTLEARVETNLSKIDAFKALDTLLSTLEDAIDELRGAVTFGGAGDVFKSKQAFTSASRLDGGTASAAGNLVAIAVENSAAAGSHTVEVLKIALAEKIGSKSFNSLTVDLGTAAGQAANSISGDFTINGVNIDVSSTDTLKDLRDRINNANTGSSATKVTASIVSVSTTEHYLVLTADDAGTAITLADPNVTGVLNDLGISSDGGTTLTNELQAYQSAEFYADGLLDLTNKRYESSLQTNGSVQLGSSGTLTFSTSDTVTYTSTDTLSDLATAITANVTGVTATVVQDGAKYRLEITGSSAFTFSETGGGSVITDMNLDNARLKITRTDNTIKDLFSGVTLSLFQAEQGTTIKIDIENDLNSVKSAISDFLDAYNAIKIFVNEQQLSEGEADEDVPGSGALYSNSALASIEQSLSLILGRGTDGVSTDYSVLAQIGIDFVDNSTVGDPLLEDTLEVDETTLDKALLNNLEDVRKLFSFDFSTSNANVVLLDFTAASTYAAAGYTLNIGAVGSGEDLSKSVTSKTALLNDAGDGVGATSSGTFSINGTPIVYDITTDTLETLATAINTAAITGITASAIADGAGKFQLQILSTQTPITVSGDTGNLVTNLTLAQQSTLIGSANINGAADGSADGSVTISGNVIVATSSTGAEGLRLLYAGSTGSVSGITLDYTVGLGANLFFKLDQLMDDKTGIVHNEIEALSDQNEVSNDRIELMLERLDYQREQLLIQFVAMETALSSMNRILDSIRQTFEVLSK